MVGFHRVPNFLLHIAGNFLIIQRLASGGIHIQQFGPNHGSGKIISHQVAQAAGLDDVIADNRKPLLGRSELSRDYVTALKTILDKLDKTDIRSERFTSHLKPRSKNSPIFLRLTNH